MTTDHEDHKGAFFSFSSQSEVAVAWMHMHSFGDTFAVVYRDAADAPWRMTLRARTYVDNKVAGSKDLKSGYNIGGGDATDQSRDDFVKTADALFADVKQKVGGTIWRCACYGPADKFLDEFKRQPFAHQRVVAEEPERPQ